MPLLSDTLIKTVLLISLVEFLSSIPKEFKLKVKIANM
jgi:hypothetical protein